MQPAFPPAARAGHDPEFGPLVSELRAGLRVRLASTVLLLVIGGLFVLVGMAQDELGLTAIASLATLPPLAFVYYQQGGLRVRLYTHGVERSGRFAKRRLPWDRLQSYRLNVMDMSAVAMAGAAGGGLGGIVGGLVAHSLTKKLQTRQALVLFGTDGSKLTIGDDLKQYHAVAESLIPYLTERLLPAARQAYDRGTPVAFGKRLSIQKGAGIRVTGVLGGQKLLPFAELASVGLERAALAIRKKDKRRPWKLVATSAVPNVHVFVRLAELGKPPAEPDDLPLAWTV
jgi:hypothetical protein